MKKQLLFSLLMLSSMSIVASEEAGASADVQEDNKDQQEVAFTFKNDNASGTMNSSLYNFFKEMATRRSMVAIKIDQDGKKFTFSDRQKRFEEINRRCERNAEKLLRAEGELKQLKAQPQKSATSLETEKNAALERVQTLEKELESAQTSNARLRKVGMATAAVAVAGVAIWGAKAWMDSSSSTRLDFSPVGNLQ